jgi:hypothetical protein
MAEYVASLFGTTQKFAKKVRKFFVDVRINSIQESQQLIDYSRDIETSVETLITINMVILDKTDDLRQKTEELEAAVGNYNRTSLYQIVTQMSDDLRNDRTKYILQFQKTIELCDEAFKLSTSLFENLTYIVSKVITSSQIRLLQESLRNIGVRIDRITETLVNLKTIQPSQVQEFADSAREIARTINDIGEISSKALELVVNGVDYLANISELDTKTHQSLALTNHSIQQVRQQLRTYKEKTRTIEESVRLDRQTVREQTALVSRLIEDIAYDLKSTVKILKTNANDTRKLYNQYRKEEKSLNLIDPQWANALRETTRLARVEIVAADNLEEEATIYIDGVLEISKNIADASFNTEPRNRRPRLQFMFSSLEEKINKIKSDKITKARGSSKEKKSPKVKTSAKKSPKVKTSAKKSPKVKTSAKKSPKVKTSAKKYM